MYMIYWTVTETDARIHHAREFATDDLRAALHFMESLRMQQRTGEAIAFITMCSENPDAVGPAGATDPGADYQWKKRRP